MSERLGNSRTSQDKLWQYWTLLTNARFYTVSHITSLTFFTLPTEKFYADPKKYALKLQLWIFKQRYLTYIAAMKHIVNTGESSMCCCNVVITEWYHNGKILLFGVCLSKPHTCGTALRKCVCNVSACLRPYNANFKHAFTYFPKIEL